MPASRPARLELTSTRYADWPWLRATVLYESRLWDRSVAWIRQLNRGAGSSMPSGSVWYSHLGSVAAKRVRM